MSGEGGVATTQGGGAVGTIEGDGGVAAVEGGTFSIGLISNITTDNWWASLDTLNTSYNQAYLSNGKVELFRLTNPGFVYVPGAAATTEPVPAVQEGEVWVVEQPVRTDMVWSDGEPVRAGDLAFYFDTVREFSLGGDHAGIFPPAVLSVSAPSDDLIRIEFEGRPGLAVWQNGVGFASFVPSHFWVSHVDEARSAAEALAAEITDQDAIDGLLTVNDDNDPENDIAEEDITQAMIDEWISGAVANEGLTVLYSVAAPMEPSVGPQVFDQWEKGAFAATISNPLYFDSGTEYTMYADGAVRMANSARGEDNVYGGAGEGDVIAQYVEGPFVSEILWVEHGTRDAAYENLTAGGVDFVYDPAGVTPGLRNELARNPNLRFSVSQSEGFRYMAFNMRKAPMSDVAFRRAVATIINKELLADTVLAGTVFPGYTIVHPDLKTFYNMDVPRAGWAAGAPMNEADRFLTAVETLKAVGYTWETEPEIDPNSPDPVVSAGSGLTMPNGSKVPELVILAPGVGYDPLRATFSIWIAQWLNDLGVPAVAEPTDFNAIQAATFPPQTPESALEWDMYVLGWSGADVSLPGTSQVAFFHSREDVVLGGGFNTPGYKSDRFDTVADAFEAATNLEAAAELTKEMDQILAEDLPYVVLFRTPIIEAYAAGVEFPTPSIMGGHSGFPDGWPASVRFSGQ